MATNIAAQEPARALNRRRWIGLFAVYLVIPLILFISAGDLAWWQAWIYALLIVAAGLGGHWWMERRNPGILAERSFSGPRPGVKAWDRILSPLMAITISFPLVIVAGLDHRFGWSAPFPLWLNIVGLLLTAAGYGFGAWAAVENRFFTGLVRIQTERGHVVCDTGPYRIVRHPSYAGNILPLPGIALGLGSAWTFIPAAVALVIVVLRTALEDRTLQDELPGYRDYARRVRYRLLPGIY